MFPIIIPMPTVSPMPTPPFNQMSPEQISLVMRIQKNGLAIEIFMFLLFILFVLYLFAMSPFFRFIIRRKNARLWAIEERKQRKKEELAQEKYNATVAIIRESWPKGWQKEDYEYWDIKAPER